MPIGAIIGAVGSAIGGAVSNIGSKRAAKEYNKGQMNIAQMNNEWNAREAAKAREWEESMMDKQNTWNLEQWNRENEYNSASAQAQRFRDAGLNPALMMGSGNAGSASSVSSANPGSVSPPVAQMPSQIPFQPRLDFISDAINSYFTNSSLSEQTISQRLGNNITAQFGSDMARAQIASAIDGRYELLNDKYRGIRDAISRELAFNDVVGKIQDVQNMRQVGRLTSAQALATSLQADGQKIMNKYIDANNQADLMVKSATWFSQFAAGKLSLQQVKKSIADTAKVMAETKGIKIQNRQAEALADSFIRTMKIENEYKQSELGSLLEHGIPSVEAAGRYYDAYNRRFESKNRADRRAINPRTEKFMSDWSDYLEKLINIRIFK